MPFFLLQTLTFVACFKASCDIITGCFRKKETYHFLPASKSSILGSRFLKLICTDHEIFHERPPSQSSTGDSFPIVSKDLGARGFSDWAQRWPGTFGVWFTCNATRNMRSISTDPGGKPWGFCIHFKLGVKFLCYFIHTCFELFLGMVKSLKTWVDWKLGPGVLESRFS